MAEYTYLTSAVDISQTEAVVAKDGYHFGPIRVFKGVTQQLEFLCVSKYAILYHNSTWKPAAMLIMLRTGKSDKPIHLCIPLPSSEQPVLVKAFEDYQTSVKQWPELHKHLFWDMAIAMIQEIADCQRGK